MLETYKKFVSDKRIPENYKLKDKIKKIGEIIREETPQLINGAKELLKWSYKNYDLALVTRGVKYLQNKKLKEHNLKHYFKYIEIVSSKNEQTFLKVIKKFNQTPENTWIIGDSIKSEIEPEINIKSKCIFFDYSHHTYKWVQERGINLEGPYWKAKSLNEIQKIIESSYVKSKI